MGDRLAALLVLALLLAWSPGASAIEAEPPPRSTTLRSLRGEVRLTPSSRWFTVALASGATPEQARRVVDEAPGLGRHAVLGSSRGRELLVRLEQGVDDAGSLARSLQGVGARGAIAHAAPALHAPDGSTLGLTRRALVRLERGADKAAVEAIVRARRGILLRELPAIGALVVATASPSDVPSLCEELRGVRGVLDAHPDFLRPVDRRSVPSDPLFEEQWYASKVCLPAALDLTRGGRGVVIAVIDDGFDLAHEDLADPARVSASALDLADGDADPSAGPLDDHGTAVAGIALASGDNARGISGFCPGCGFLPIRRGGTELDDVDALLHAADAGAHVINASWGYSYPSSGVVGAVRYALERGRGGAGSLVVFAAGNGGSDIDEASDISAIPGVIAVMASDRDDRLSPESSFGQGALAAPSGGQTTTDRTIGGYAAGAYTRTFGGTSGAAPVVAGTAGLVFSLDPSRSAAEVRALLFSTALVVGSERSASAGAPPVVRRVHTGRAVASAAGLDPDAERPCSGSAAPGGGVVSSGDLAGVAGCRAAPTTHVPSHVALVLALVLGLLRRRRARPLRPS